MNSLRPALRRSYVGPFAVAIFLLTAVNIVLRAFQRPVAAFLEQAILTLLRETLGDVMWHSPGGAPSEMFALLVGDVARGTLLFGIAWLMAMWLYAGQRGEPRVTEPGHTRHDLR